MKFNVQSKLLLSRLNAVSKVVSNNNAFAILDNFLFELQSDRLVVTGSDMETRLTTNIEVTAVEGTGKFAIDVKRTINSLKELPDTALSFEINDETLAVKVTCLTCDYHRLCTVSEIVVLNKYRAAKCSAYTVLCVAIEIVVVNMNCTGPYPRMT